MGRKQQAYDYLKNAIVTNALPPGAPVREMELAEELKMSRTPIREAMRELETEGVLISYPSRGTFVLSLSPSDVEEIYELRTLHEVWALEKSIFRITDEELDLVHKTFTEAFEHSDWETCHKADRLLHRLIVEKSGSKRLIAFLNTLNTQAERIRRVSAKDFARLAVSYREHMEIINLIRKRDLPACRESLRSHLRSVADSAIELSKVIDFSFNSLMFDTQPAKPSTVDG